MNDAMTYRLLADGVLVLHVGIVLFVVGGLLLILIGNALINRRAGWRWVNAWWFRVLHLLAIAIVVAEAWLGVECPLTTLEVALRVRAGDAVYAGDFIAHWLQRLLYVDLPHWAFTLAYSLFAAAVLATWWRFPPQARIDTAHADLMPAQRAESARRICRNSSQRRSLVSGPSRSTP